MSDESRRLLQVFEALPGEGRRTLLEMAEFLAQRYPAQAPAMLADPEPIPRPESESVVKAIKRLSASYHMVDKSKILHETSSLMSQHVMQGRDAREVIDDLEVLFERHYRKMVERLDEDLP